MAETVKVVTTVKGERTEHELEAGPGGFTCIVHQQGIRVDVPAFVEINPRDTLDCMGAMSQEAWTWISTGGLFKELFKIAFEDSPDVELPENIMELNRSDLGIVHVAGMIVLGCEAMFEGRNVFFRNPETYLHPKTERCIVGVFKKMLEYCGRGNGTVTKVEEAPPEEQLEKLDAPKPPVEKQTTPEDKELTVKWLKCMDPAKEFARVGDKVFTVADLILEVGNDSNVGKMLVQKFVAMRDGE